MMIKITVFIFIAASMALTACAESSELGKDDFVTTTISDVFNKVGQYTSGEKTILDPVETGSKKSVRETDALGRPVSDPAIKPLRRPSASE